MPASSGCRFSPAARGERRQAQARALDELVVGEDLGGRAVRQDAAVGQDDGAVGVLGHELHVVGDHEDRRALGVELAQQRQQLVGAGAILAEGRLVEREHRCSGDQRSADREPPLLTAREEERVGVRLGGQAEPLEQRLGARAHLVVGEVLQPQAVRDLVEDGVRDELVLGVLEHESDAR